MSDELCWMAKLIREYHCNPATLRFYSRRWSVCLGVTIEAYIMLHWVRNQISLTFGSTKFRMALLWMRRTEKDNDQRNRPTSEAEYYGMPDKTGTYAHSTRIISLSSNGEQSLHMNARIPLHSWPCCWTEIFMHFIWSVSLNHVVHFHACLQSLYSQIIAVGRQRERVGSGWRQGGCLILQPDRTSERTPTTGNGWKRAV